MTPADGCEIAPKGAKCDQWGAGADHGTEPIMLPFRNQEMNACFQLRELERRWPCHGEARRSLPLFPDEHGEVYPDWKLAAILQAIFVLLVGPARAVLYSGHSFRVALATYLRAAGATGPLQQAFGRWMNPESLRIYARLGRDEYAYWLDKMLTVRVDTARTTSTAILSAEEAVIQPWHDIVEHIPTARRRPGVAASRRSLLGGPEAHDTFGDAIATLDPPAAASSRPPPPPLTAGDRILVYWTDENEWFAGQFTSSRCELGDDGQQQRISRVLYDAVPGRWGSMSLWHCLDDTRWQVEAAAEARAL
jgi:hypothetical protein